MRVESPNTLNKSARSLSCSHPASVPDNLQAILHGCNSHHSTLHLLFSIGSPPVFLSFEHMIVCSYVQYIPVKSSCQSTFIMIMKKSRAYPYTLLFPSFLLSDFLFHSSRFISAVPDHLSDHGWLHRFLGMNPYIFLIDIGFCHTSM